jgi:hypothetical protein
MPHVPLEGAAELDADRDLYSTVHYSRLLVICVWLSVFSEV